MPPRKKQRDGKGPMRQPSRFYPWENSPIFFESQEDLDKFHNHFEAKPISPIRTCDSIYLELKNATIVHNALQKGNWYGFLAMPYSYINETLIRAFYSNLRRNDEG